MPFTEVPRPGGEFSNKKPDIYEKFHGSKLNLPGCPTLEEMGGDSEYTRARRKK